MELILLEKIANLGNLGDKVNVKAGYGRNFLLPQGKATALLLQTLLRLKRVAPSWKNWLPRRKLTLNPALLSWLNWKSPSPLPRAMKANCSAPSVLTISLKP